MSFNAQHSLNPLAVDCVEVSLQAVVIDCPRSASGSRLIFPAHISGQFLFVAISHTGSNFLLQECDMK